MTDLRIKKERTQCMGLDPFNPTAETCDIEGCDRPSVELLSVPLSPLKGDVTQARVCGVHRAMVVPVAGGFSIGGRGQEDMEAGRTTAHVQRIADLGPLPKVHPRSLVVERATVDLSEALLGVWNKHGLTVSERVLLLSQALERVAARCVQSERETSDG